MVVSVFVDDMGPRSKSDEVRLRNLVLLASQHTRTRLEVQSPPSTRGVPMAFQRKPKSRKGVGGQGTEESAEADCGEPHGTPLPQTADQGQRASETRGWKLEALQSGLPMVSPLQGRALFHGMLLT